MYRSAIMAVTATAAALLLSARPAVADDDWIGPDPALCGGDGEAARGFEVFLMPEAVFYVPQKAAAPCADTNDPHDSQRTD
ncbi:hypothetical protein [Nonomuraea sp. NPDC050786]|uniref:hypothetical protein n=1 Tax=Nonomuraea sp. NPDC050786 TaxID=3154840 RepID=UPI0033CC7182